MEKKKKQKKAPLVTKFQKYKNTQPEDLQARKKIKITEDDFKLFLKVITENPEFSDLYDECRIIEWADVVHEKSRIPISKLRAKLSKIECNSYVKNGYNIKETIIYRYLPLIVTARDKIGTDNRIIEAELLFPQEHPAFKEIPWQEHAVDMLQLFRDKPDLVSSPLFKSEENEKFILIFKGISGEETRYEFPLYKNYESMITQLENKYTFTKNKNQPDKDSYFIKDDDKDDKHQEVLMGFYEGIMSFNQKDSKQLKTHLKYETWNVLHKTLEGLSSEVYKKERLEKHISEMGTDKHFQKKRLKETIESSGGSLEGVKYEKDGDRITLEEMLEDKDTSNPLDESIQAEDKLLTAKEEILQLLQENPKIVDILQKQREKEEPLNSAERKTLQRFRDNLKKKYGIKSISPPHGID
jgi:hypothetical protein